MHRCTRAFGDSFVALHRNSSRAHDIRHLPRFAYPKWRGHDLYQGYIPRIYDRCQASNDYFGMFRCCPTYKRYNIGTPTACLHTPSRPAPIASEWPFHGPIQSDVLGRRHFSQRRIENRNGFIDLFTACGKGRHEANHVWPHRVE